MEKNMDAMIVRLKKMLLSRNAVLQDKSIQYMIRSLKNPKQFDLISTTYLNADMIQYLCEPLLSINTPLLESICLCVWMLSKNKKFYERNDVLYTCNCLMRTLVFLISTKDKSVSDLIQLLEIIIKKGGTNLQEVCNMPQILTIVKMIFNKSQDLPGRCVINAISILTYFLSCPSIEFSYKLYNTSMTISEAICRSVTRNCIIDPHVVDIASNLSSSLLRLYSTITSRILINEHLTIHREKAKLLKNVAWYMIKHIVLPFIIVSKCYTLKKFTLFKQETNMNLYYKSYRKGIKSLINPFKESLPPRVLQNIANHYAASKIIRNLYELIEYNEIGILAEELLFEILFYLSSEYLEINSHWPGGTVMYRHQMVWSFKNFPKTPKDICSVLINSKNTDLKNSILIFMYFYLLTCSNVENESIYLEPICIYLCSIQNEMPIPVIKAILYNISISFVSHRALNSVSGLALATKRLVALINCQMFGLVFTYHPSLLYFLFATSLVPEEIQLQLIKQWILNLDDISFVELETFCLKNNKAKLCLLNLLINDTTIENNKLQIGFNIVKKIITIENDFNKHNTLLIIWEMLPTNLGSFCCTEDLKIMGATNLMFLLNLTESCTFHGLNISINEHRNIVYTISSIIKSYQSTFTEQYSLLSSLLQHLLTLIQLSDGDALNTITKHQDFICVLQNLCLSENNKVCFLAFNTIVKLCQLEKEKTKKKHKILYPITLKCEYILNAMSRSCQNCVISSTTLLQIIIHYYEEDIYDTVRFDEVPTIDFFKSVFIQLETIISQGLDMVSDHIWECIKTILSASLSKHLQKLPELQIEFATDPWLNFLLSNLNSFNEKCLEFLHFWFTNFVLKRKNSFTTSGVQVLCPSLFDKTIIYISKTIVSQIYEKSEVASKAKTIINMILKNTFLLPNELKCKMNHFLSQN